jgi:hypothetical protein
MHGKKFRARSSLRCSDLLEFAEQSRRRRCKQTVNGFPHLFSGKAPDLKTGFFGETSLILSCACSEEPRHEQRKKYRGEKHLRHFSTSGSA